MIQTGLKFFIFSLCLSSCAFFKKISNPPKEEKLEVKNEFRLKDQSGQYSLSLESGPGKDNKTYVVKRKLKTFGDKKAKILEKSISISIKEKKSLVPKISQFSVWYNKHRHFSQIEFNRDGKQLKVTWESPEPKYNGIKYFPIKDGKEIFCFYTQVIACARHVKFLADSIRGKSDKLKMKIIWDGHPFFQQQFTDFNPPIISSAVLRYDGKNRRGHRRFSLKVEGESIFFFIDNQYRLVGQYWIAKGLSIERLKN
ncbi:MAG: hypothetical protein E2O68_01580 [Deltaproteobacteria bacterium]|nr:MAG: hypothetical protein E2O68_01580 [Deltaproteobacteria bacterium]